MSEHEPKHLNKEKQFITKDTPREGIPVKNEQLNNILSRLSKKSNPFEGHAQGRKKLEESKPELAQPTQDGLIVPERFWGQIMKIEGEHGVTDVKLSEHPNRYTSNFGSYSEGAIDIANLDTEHKYDCEIDGSTVEFDKNRVFFQGNVWAKITGDIHFTDSDPYALRKISLIQNGDDRLQPRLHLQNAQTDASIRGQGGYLTIEDSKISGPIYVEDGTQTIVENSIVEAPEDDRAFEANGEKTKIVVIDSRFDSALVMDGATLTIAGNSRAVDTHPDSYLIVGEYDDVTPSSLRFELRESEKKDELKIPIISAQLIIRDGGVVTIPSEMLDEEHLQSKINISPQSRKPDDKTIIIQEGKSTYHYTWRELSKRTVFANGQELKEWHEEQKKHGKKPH